MFKQNVSRTYTVISEKPHPDIKICLLTSDDNGTENLITTNGNSLHSVAYFKIKLIELVDSEYTALGFNNLTTLDTEFIIIPTSEFLKRLSVREPAINNQRKVLLCFWLMDDRCLFETMNQSIEGEWYFLSKGINGRMADKTDWCYTKFLNNWNQLFKIS